VGILGRPTLLLEAPDEEEETVLTEDEPGALTEDASTAPDVEESRLSSEWVVLGRPA